MEETIIHADVFIRRFKGARAELYVNDIPVAVAGGGQQPFASVPVPEFLLDGTNTLSVVLGAGDTPGTAKGEPSGAKAEPNMEVWARIVRLKDGEMAGPGSGETLMELQWTGESEDPFPKIVSTSADLGPMSGPWQWQTAEVLTLDKSTLAAAIEIIGKIQDDYANGKTDMIVEMAKTKHEETERAYPIYEKGGMEGMFKEEIATFSSHPQWKRGDLPQEDYDLRLVAGGRMIQAIAKDWRPVVRMEGGAFGYHMMIGRVDGKWLILR